MKKSIYLLLVSMIMSSPLHAGTAGSVPMIRDVLDEKDVQESEYVKVPRASLQKLQQRNEELEKENNEIKQRTKVEEVKEKREEPEEASLSSSFSSLSFENQGSEILLGREEELEKAKALSIFLQTEKERKGKDPEEASSSSTSSSSISSPSALPSETQGRKIEEQERKSTKDTPAPPSPDLSFKENSSQPWLYPKLTELRSSIVGTLDVWFPDLAFKRKISEAGFDPKLIDLYSEFSPTFARHAQIRSDEVTQFKSLISKELFKEVLINIHKDIPLLLKASADLGSDIGIYTFSYKDCILDPYMYYAEWLYDGIGGFKKDEQEALKVMYKYGSAGHEGLRRMHLIKLYRAGRLRATSTKGLIYFQEILQEYVDQKSEIATKIAGYLTDKKKCTVMQLTIDDLTQPNLEDFQRTVFQYYSQTHLSKEKREQINHIQSLFKGENGYKKNPQEASQLSVEYGIFLAPSAAIKYQQ